MTTDEKFKKSLEKIESEVTESEQLEVTAMLNATAAPEKLVLYCHGLSSEKYDKIRFATKELGNSVLVSKLTDEVTHLILNVDKESKSCTEDVIYYNGLMFGCRIVDVDWVLESSDRGQWVDEDVYVPEGSRSCRQGAPAKALTNALAGKPKLFDGCHIYLQGSFGKPYPTKADLIRILKNGGADVLTREPDPEFIPEKERKLPYHAEAGSQLEQCSHFLIYQEGQNSKEPLIKYNMGHIKSMPTAWLFECINNFALVEPFR